MQEGKKKKNTTRPHQPPPPVSQQRLRLSSSHMHRLNTDEKKGTKQPNKLTWLRTRQAPMQCLATPSFSISRRWAVIVSCRRSQFLCAKQAEQQQRSSLTGTWTSAACLQACMRWLPGAVCKPQGKKGRLIKKTVNRIGRPRCHIALLNTSSGLDCA